MRILPMKDTLDQFWFCI